MLKQEVEVAIAPAGAFGSALAAVASDNGHKVNLCFYNPEDSEKFQKTHRTRRLRKVRQNKNVGGISDWEEGISPAEAIIVSPPSYRFHEVVRRVLPYARKDAIFLIGTKGLEPGTHSRMSEVLLDEGSNYPDLVDRIGVISGPNLALEVGRRRETGAVISGYEDGTIGFWQSILNTPKFKVYREGDVIGVEYAAAFKNIMALGAGMVQRLNAGDDGKAFYFTQALAEMTALGVAYGAQPSTFLGLAGIGDWYLSSASGKTRNGLAGQLLAEGKTIKDIEDMGILAEGLYTIKPTVELAIKRNLDTPIIYALHDVLYDGLSIPEAVARFMGREVGEEYRGVRSPSYYAYRLAERFRRKLLLRYLAGRPIQH